MADALARYKEGKPILFYTWTPNWTVGLLKPGEDVVWIGTPEPSLPDDQKQFEDLTTVAGVKGCVSDPCEMGRSEEHTSELLSLMRISSAVICLKIRNWRMAQTLRRLPSTCP